MNLSPILLVTLGAIALMSRAAQAQYQVELTFDDQESGTGAATDHASVPNLEGNDLKAALVGTAERTAMDAGQYGRGFAPGAGGYLEITGWQPAPRFLAYFWLRPLDTQAGTLVGHAGSFSVGFDAGELVVSVTRADGFTAEQTLGLTWPSDSSFHHVAVRSERTASATTFFASLDFEPEVSVSFPFRPAPSTEEMLRFGEGLAGIIDEVIVGQNSVATKSLEMDRFNRMPDECPAGLACAEEVINLTPPGLAHEVPVRFKSIYEPGLCSAGSDCPVVFEISGGSACPNDYGAPQELAALAGLGMVVVTIDPYCEVVSRFLVNTEIPQLIATKNYVFASSSVRHSIAGPSYYAGGCSHGADAVMIWSLYEDDFPQRVFARSSTGAGICGQYAGKVCGVDPDQLPDPEPLQASHELSDFVGHLDASITSTREIARSWGVNLSGPVCNTDGSVACTEEGKHPNTYGSRRFRTIWQRLEPIDAPTAYFVEDQNVDCQHCAPYDSEAFRCGACMLRHGRSAMSTECPACLTYDSKTISAGGEAEACIIDASWFEDPLTSIPARDDSGPSDGDELPDGEPSGGCNCSSVPTAPAVLICIALCTGLRRRRRLNPFKSQY